MLARGKTLPLKYKNHPLNGNLKGYYDCHILPDWVLVYKIEKDRLVLLLVDIGTHADLLEWLNRVLGFTSTQGSFVFSTKNYHKRLKYKFRNDII